MEPIKVGELKIDNMNVSDVPNISDDSSEIKQTEENTSKDTQKSTDESGATKHVVTYVGGSEYIDASKHVWHKGDEMTYSDDEYNERNDIHFMVKYGEMKHTIVTM